ncbi:MAG: hypothetical protein K2G67_00900, partial [Muribaculaceae bacterium]|nr:hypothetical protein [Muribaculaceae bacterium]
MIKDNVKAGIGQLQSSCPGQIDRFTVCLHIYIIALGKEVTSRLASLGAFDFLISVTYLGMLLSSRSQIHSKAATSTTP